MNDLTPKKAVLHFFASVLVLCIATLMGALPLEILLVWLFLGGGLAWLVLNPKGNKGG